MKYSPKSFFSLEEANISYTAPNKSNPVPCKGFIESINKKLWELAGVYRGINFKDNVQKIDFTVGFVALEYFEEKEEIDGTKDSSKVYWSTCNDDVAEKVKNNLSGYISRLEDETTFKEFKNVMEVVRIAISGARSTMPAARVSLMGAALAFFR